MQAVSKSQVLTTALAVTLSLAMFAARVPAQVPLALASFAVRSCTCSPVLDPKLPGGQAVVRVTFTAQSGIAFVRLGVRRNGVSLGAFWLGAHDCAQGALQQTWDGKLAQQWLVPADYELEVTALHTVTGMLASAVCPVRLVRLGITEIAALPNGVDTEWQMVYFKRGTQVAPTFWATPAIHEYLCIADSGEVSDLDEDNGDPRPPVPIHLATDSPPMEGTAYEDDRYNLPICYRVGTRPRFEVRFGAAGTGPGGIAVPAGYPRPGLQIRCQLSSSLGAWTALQRELVPDRSAFFVGPPLPGNVARTDVACVWNFECSTDGGASWQAVPGQLSTAHRFYTVIGRPRFGGTIGTQYAGPWVEVADYVSTWGAQLGIDTSSEAGVTEAAIKGFGGQIGPLSKAIEDVRYDTYILGGDGGASHYYLATHGVQLARLLDNHANGLFVNCSDCAASTAAMLGMMGISGVQMQRLGPMTLRSIRGIGAPSYTTNLWGTGWHAFSYHHVITRTAGTTVCDACLWVDDDDNPSQLPSVPGYNIDRLWSTIGRGYMERLATGTVTFNLETLPTLQ